MMDDIRWLAGVDWASEKHTVCLLDANGQVVGERDVDHTGAGLSELCGWLLEKTGTAPGQIAVAIEMPHGPVVEALLERGFAVYAINPKQLDRFRDRFTVAGAKDDSRDAHVLGDALRTDRHALRRLAVQDPLVIELREWSRMSEDLQQERNRLANRVREQLWRYYPQALKITDDLAADWFLDVWRHVPTPAKAARISAKTITRILKAHRIRRIDAAEALRILRQTPLVVAPGTAEAASAHIDTVAARLRLVNQQVKQAHRKLDELCAALATPTESAPGQVCEQRDVAILRSSPGIGRIVLATLLAEASEPLRRRDYHALRTLSGAAPVTRRSGKQCCVIRRRACNKRLENALYHWARVAMQHDPISRCRYTELRRRGHSHGRALRGVGDRLLYVLCKPLERQVLYDPDHARSQMTAAA
jgi:transposase